MATETRVFDVQTIQPASNVLIIGKRQQGSTTLVRDILHAQHMQSPFKEGWVFLTGEHNLHEWSDTLPREHIFCTSMDEYEHKLWDIIHCQKTRYGQMFNGEKTPHVFVVLDEVFVDDRALYNSDALRDVFINGRALGIFLCLLLQHPIPIHPMACANIDHTFVLNHTTFDRSYPPPLTIRAPPRLPPYHAWVYSTDDEHVYTYKAEMHASNALAGQWYTEEAK